MQKDTLLNIATQAAKLPESERESFIKEETNSDSNLTQKIETLIQQQQAADFHEQTLATIDLKPGDMVGPYHILEEIGSGGMGIVFLVEQKVPVHRRLALKVIRIGMDTKDVLARFELERQALALMSHPNVAAVVDAGITENGRPYFLMEYVPGVSITKYANDNRMTMDSRIKLVMQACKGVLHAHQKGILHRDLKPGNIIVTEKEGEPLVKIIDFGVAKSTQQKLSDNTVYTQLGSFIGTPNYISPEQAGASSQDVDTRTDLYSLGIILYEMLVGELPFDSNTFHNKNLADIQRIIKEKQAPSPHDRLKSLSYGKSIATKRRSSFTDIRKKLKGDLSCIIMHAIEKNRNERYASVSAFDEDLKRYLNGLPIEAQPHSSIYLMRRFIGRHKLMVASIFSVLLALSIGLGSALISLKHAERETIHAERESAHAAAVSALVSGILLNADPWNKSFRHEITLNSVIVELEKKLDNKELLQGKEFDKARELDMENSLLWSLREHIGDLHSSVGNEDAAENNYRQAIELHGKTSEGEELKLIDLNLKRVKVLTKSGNLDIAENLFSQAVAKLTPPQNKAEASLLLNATGVQISRGKIKEYIEFETNLLKIAEDFFSKQSKEYVKQSLKLANGLVYNYDLVSLNKALSLAKSARIISHELTPRNLDLEYQSIQQIVSLLIHSRNPKEAIIEAGKFVNWCKKEFGDENIRTIKAEISLATANDNIGNYKAMLEIVTRIEPLIENSVQSGHYLMRDLVDLKGDWLMSKHRYKEALPLLEKALSIAERKNRIPNIAYFSGKVSLAAYYTGDLDKAQNNMIKAIENSPEKTGLNLSINLSELSQIFFAMNKTDAALNESKNALKADPTNFTAYTIQGLIAFQNKDFENAEKYMRNAAKGYLKDFGGTVNDPDHNDLTSDIVMMLINIGKYNEAYELAKDIVISDLTTVNAAAVQLKIMAAKVVNGKSVDKNLATKLYNNVDTHWSKVTLQNQSAKKALTLIKSSK